MKELKHYINEAFKINKNTKIQKYKYFPKNKKELEKNIFEHFYQNIYDLNDIDVFKITDMNYLFGSFRNNFIEYSKKNRYIIMGCFKCSNNEINVLYE